VELKEWFDEENEIGIPRLIGIVLRKKYYGQRSTVVKNK
jgi:hypothetical protein